jgi:hypothetical protein
MEKLDGDAPYKSCSARVFIDHIHETNAQKLERQILRTACKRKAVDMISERPSKIINSGHHPCLLQHQYHQEYCGIRLDFWVVPGEVSFFPYT